MNRVLLPTAQEAVGKLIGDLSHDSIEVRGRDSGDLLKRGATLRPALEGARKSAGGRGGRVRAGGGGPSRVILARTGRRV